MSDKCPTCEHKLRGVRYYPRILVVGFERQKFPDLIGSNIADTYENTEEDIGRLAKFTSQEVVERLRASLGNDIPFGEYLLHKYQTNGKVIYICQVNITDSIRGVLQLSQVGQYLSKLEDAVGKEIVSAEVKPPKIQGSDFSIHLLEREAQGVHRKCGVHLTGKYSAVFYGALTVPLVNTDIGTLMYIGKLNE